MAYTTFNASYGSAKANYLVNIFETSTGIPATILSATTGGLVNTTGSAQLDGSGNLSVVIDTAKTFTIQVVPSGFPVLPKVIVASSTTAYVVPDGVNLVTFTGTAAQPITLPANPTENQVVILSWAGAVNPTISANAGHTLATAGPTGAQTAGTSTEFRFNKAANGGTANAWYRIR